MPTSISVTRRSLLLLVAAALVAGVYFRFRGLGAAPLSVDEYYLARSVDNVLRSGVPAFSCGGYYARGLLLQYLSAALRLAGLTPELAPRLVGALCGLLTLPAAYILGCRIRGPKVGLLAVIVLALSVWEIEMARFGRMYAPFQPICAWYLVFFLGYTVDRDTRALWPMWLLSLIAPLVWEGGVLLTMANLLPPFLQRSPGVPWSRADWIYVSSAALAFAAACWFVTADFRGHALPTWPAGAHPARLAVPTDPLAALDLPLTRLPRHAGWIVLAGGPVIAMLYALRWLWGWRARPVVAAGLLSVLLAALLHQFLAVTALLLLMMMMRQITWEELFAKDAAPLHICIAVSALFWLAFGIATTDWHSPAAGTIPRALAAFVYQYLRYPDFVGVVVRPWARAVPLLGLGLGLLIGVGLLRLARSAEPRNAERVLSIAFVVLLLAASATHPPRQETRYVFFLYPLAVVLALTTLDRVARFALKPRRAAIAVPLLSLGGFAMSEDFQPHHLLNIDRPAEIFRTEMNPDMQAHLEIRNDYRDLARWLQQRVTPDRDLVINGVHGLDYYYPRINYFFVDQRNPDFPDWACRHGTVERWGNFPLIDSVDSLKSKIAASRYTYLIDFLGNDPGLLAALAQFEPRITWSQGFVAVVELRGSGQTPGHTRQ
jgi:hypothetical protein